MKLYYAGIGSRNTPNEILSLLTSLAEQLALKGYILRSGGAKGADSAFEKGCDKVHGNKEIFLPWKNFENNTSSLFINSIIPNDLITIAKEFYPSFDYSSKGVKKIYARNVQQILGEKPNVSLPSSFVLCWTDRSRIPVAGTMFGITLAESRNIPVFNLYEKNVLQKFEEKVLNSIDKTK